MTFLVFHPSIRQGVLFHQTPWPHVLVKPALTQRFLGTILVAKIFILKFLTKRKVPWLHHVTSRKCGNY